MQEHNKPLLKNQNHVLPLLGNEVDEWHHKSLKNSSCSTPSLDLASSFFVKSNFTSHALTKLKCL